MKIEKLTAKALERLEC